jgi:hypothetical protein
MRLGAHGQETSAPILTRRSNHVEKLAVFGRTRKGKQSPAEAAVYGTSGGRLTGEPNADRLERTVEHSEGFPAKTACKN